MPESLTLSQYVDMAEMFSEFVPQLFIRFILTGQQLLDSQVLVDPSHNLIHEQHRLSLLRDYDTVIGLTRDIVVQAPFAILSVPNITNCIGTNIHIACPPSMSDTAAGRPMHQIPNFMFGFWGQRHQIYIFFPSLATEDRRDPQLTEREMADFSASCIGPLVQMYALQRHFDQECGVFGGRMRPEELEARGTNIFPERTAKFLGSAIRKNAREFDTTWATDCFFMHTIRGTSRSIHHIHSAHAAEGSLAIYLRDANLPGDVSKTGEWWIDVGVEIASAEGMCLQWTTPSHLRMVQEAFRIDEESASRIIDIWGNEYARDLASHLTAVSGCRIEPGPQSEGYYGAKYFRMYTTDSVLPYAPEQEYYGTAITTTDAMGPIQPPNFVTGLYDVYKGASKSNTSNARVEVRVPLGHALDALQSLTPAVVRECLMGFTPRDWWLFKAYRARGIGGALCALSRSSPRLRVTPGALLLTAACVWLINSIHSRPDDGPASRELMHAVLPLADAVGPDCDLSTYPCLLRGDSGTEGGTTLPHIPFGVIFLRQIQAPLGVPRIPSGGSFLSAQAFRHFFSMPLEELRYLHTRDALSNMDGDEWGEAGEAFDSELTQMWHQFFVDVLLETTCTPYLKTPVAERAAVNEEIFRNENLFAVWTACQYQISGPTEWRMVFNRLFPTPESKTNQKYMQYTYFQDWRRISTAIGPIASRELRDQLSLRVSGLRWIPYAGEGGIWSTSVGVETFTRLPLGSVGPAPRILFKRSEPRWDGSSVS